MSLNNLSTDGEFRYVIQWFNEWSGLQRDDFIPVLKECLNEDASPVFINGIGSTGGRPMSLFQCRIKLFREWTPKWPAELKYKLRDTLFEIDSKVSEKITPNSVEEAVAADVVSEVAAVQKTTETNESERNSLAPVISEETDNASKDAIKTTESDLVNNTELESDINIPQAQVASDAEALNNPEPSLII